MATTTTVTHPTLRPTITNNQSTTLQLQLGPMKGLFTTLPPQLLLLPVPTIHTITVQRLHRISRPTLSPRAIPRSTNPTILLSRSPPKPGLLHRPLTTTFTLRRLFPSIPFLLLHRRPYSNSRMSPSRKGSPSAYPILTSLPHLLCTANPPLSRCMMTRITISGMQATYPSCAPLPDAQKSPSL